MKFLLHLKVRDKFVKKDVNKDLKHTLMKNPFMCDYTKELIGIVIETTLIKFNANYK